MESDWIKILLAACGILFAIGGAVSALLQAKWWGEQRKTLRKMTNMLTAMRGKYRS